MVKTRYTTCNSTSIFFFFKWVEITVSTCIYFLKHLISLLVCLFTVCPTPNYCPGRICLHDTCTCSLLHTIILQGISNAKSTSYSQQTLKMFVNISVPSSNPRHFIHIDLNTYRSMKNCYSWNRCPNKKKKSQDLLFDMFAFYARKNWQSQSKKKDFMRIYDEKIWHPLSIENCKFLE